MRARGSDEYESIVALIPDDFSNPSDSLAEIRAKFDFVHGQPVGDGVMIEDHELGLWVRPDGPHDDRVVRFAHSGGFVTSTAAMCAFWAAIVARECNLAVFLAEYSLAPRPGFRRSSTSWRLPTRCCWRPATTRPAWSSWATAVVAE